MHALKRFYEGGPTRKSPRQKKPYMRFTNGRYLGASGFFSSRPSFIQSFKISGVGPATVSTGYSPETKCTRTTNFLDSKWRNASARTEFIRMKCKIRLTVIKTTLCAQSYSHTHAHTSTYIFIYRVYPSSITDLAFERAQNLSRMDLLVGKERRPRNPSSLFGYT